DQRVKETKWVVLRWPTPSMAQLAGMSTQAFEDFYFDVCTLDYRKLQPGMKALKGLMEKTDQVEIKAPGTELTSSIRGIQAVIRGCSSQCATSCSTRKSPAHSISPRAKLTKKPITETAARFTGIWSASNAAITAVAKFISTAN